MKDYSKLAKTLRKLIDAGGYTRADWAAILDTHEITIDQWLCDANIPEPQHLRGLWSTLLEDTRVRDDYLEEFYQLMQQPAYDVSPHGNLMLPTIGDYMASVVKNAFLGMLETIPPYQQEEVLLEAAELCRKKRTNKSYPTVKEIRYNLFHALIDDLNRRAKANGQK